jgi:hypothetical protein
VHAGFSWDLEKAARNLRKHGVSFEEAASTFADPLSITVRDSQHSSTEERSLSIGRSSEGRLLVVSHADEEHRIRIISARLATPRERRSYGTSI